MLWNKRGLFLGLTAIGIGLLFSILLSSRVEQPEMAPSTQEPKVLLHCNFYNEKDFISSVEQAKDYDIGDKQLVSSETTIYSERNLIWGGITPHHLLAGKLIASFFKTIAKAKPEIVVVVAPNHKGIGTKNIQTGGWDWDTPFGILKGDPEKADFLVTSKKADFGEAVLQQDHSISGLIPYVKYYMPNAKVLPILVHGALEIGSAIQLGTAIPKMCASERFVVIASADFSHYLSMEEADKKDAETFNTIKSGNLEKLSMFGNDNLDSPTSIITLLSAMQAEGTSGFKLLEHSNAQRIVKLKSDSTTSYFTIMWFGK